MPNQLGGRAIIKKGAGAVGSYEVDRVRLGVLALPDGPIAQPFIADLLHHEIAGEATGRLDDDRADAVAFNLFEHGGKAWPLLDGIGAAHRGIVELADDLEVRPLRKVGDCRALPMLAVFVGADVGGRGRAQVGDCRGAGLGHRITPPTLWAPACPFP